jgi:hypothetical protein
VSVVYRDDVVRISIRELRGRFKRRTFDQLETVTVHHGPVAATVSITRAAAPTAIGGSRRALVCPRCGRATSAIGVVPVVDGYGYWACAHRSCGNWKSRKTPKTVRSCSP